MEFSPFRIHIRQLPGRCGEVELKSLYSPYGRVLSVEILYSEDYESQNSYYEEMNAAPSRSAWVIFNSAISAWDAYRHTNGAEFMDIVLIVSTPQAATTASHAQHGLVEPQAWGALPSSVVQRDRFETALAALGINLPPFEEVLRRGRMAAHFRSAQLLVSFKTQQDKRVMIADLLRDLFGVVGDVADVQLKQNGFDLNSGAQHGYGFVLFGKTWLAVLHAVVALQVFKKRRVCRITLDCNLSHQLVQLLSVVRAEFGIDLPAILAPIGAGAFIAAAVVSHAEAALREKGLAQDAGGARLRRLGDPAAEWGDRQQSHDPFPWTQSWNTSRPSQLGPRRLRQDAPHAISSAWDPDPWAPSSQFADRSAAFAPTEYARASRCLVDVPSGSWGDKCVNAYRPQLRTADEFAPFWSECLSVGSKSIDGMASESSWYHSRSGMSVESSSIDDCLTLGAPRLRTEDGPSSFINPAPELDCPSTESLLQRGGDSMW